MMLPFGFLLADGILRWASGKRDYRDAGADVCLAGFSLYVGTVLGLLYDGKLEREVDIVTALVIMFFGTAAWWLCIVLSYSRITLRRSARGRSVRRISGWLQPIAAILIGTVTSFYLTGLSWQLTSGKP
jgi:hypothetical protein